MEILKKLRIDTLPPENIMVKIIKIKESDQDFYFAHIYNDMSDFKERLGTLVALDLHSLVKDLKNVYGLDKPPIIRDFSNFIEWFSDISGHVPLNNTDNLIDKF